MEQVFQKEAQWIQVLWLKSYSSESKFSTLSTLPELHLNLEIPGLKGHNP